jgi:hypothetical protein
MENRKFENQNLEKVVDIAANQKNMYSNILGVV